MAAVLALALAGCSTTQAPAPGLTDDERAAIQELQRETLWESYGFADSERPPDPEIVVVSNDDWGVEYVRCMNDAGFDEYIASGSGYIMGPSDDAKTQEQVHTEALANYVCSVRLWPENDEGWYSRAEMNYLYDYFDEVLIPCLVAHDIQIFQAPTRQEFVEQYGWWHPYTSVLRADQNALYSDRQMLVECPPVPPGVTDPGYARSWDFWRPQ